MLYILVSVVWQEQFPSSRNVSAFNCWRTTFKSDVPKAEYNWMTVFFLPFLFGWLLLVAIKYSKKIQHGVITWLLAPKPHWNTWIQKCNQCLISLFIVVISCITTCMYRYTHSAWNCTTRTAGRETRMLGLPSLVFKLFILKTKLILF